MRNGRVNFNGNKSGSFTAGSGVSTVTLLDPITDEWIVLRHNPVLKKIWVNEYEIPGTFQNVVPSIRDSQLFVNGLKVEVDEEGLWINGQRVVNGEVQPILQIIVEPKSNLAFFPQPNPNDEDAHLLSNKDEEKGCCCTIS